MYIHIYMYDIYMFYHHVSPKRNVDGFLGVAARSGNSGFTNGQGRVRQDAFVEADVDVERVQMMPKSRDLAIRHKVGPPR